MMGLYAVRDRLLNYFQQPFVGPDDNQVKASLAQLVNNEDTTNAIAKAPAHFELWKLAEIDTETGKTTSSPEFLCDATSLIRGGVRGEPGAIAGNPAMDQVTRGKQGPPGAATGWGRANGRPPENAPQGAYTAGTETPGTDRGSPAEPGNH